MLFRRSSPPPIPIKYPSPNLIAFARRLMYAHNREQVDEGYMSEDELTAYMDNRTESFRGMTEAVLAMRLLRDMDDCAFHNA